MPKRNLTASEAFDLRQALHVAVLEALMASRRWQPSELVFQGGTSLHLVYGSPRLSEDLDFLVKASLKLDSISSSVAARLRGAPWVPRDASVSVTPAKEGHNPHAFVVAIGGPSLIGSVRVKVELWQTPEEALAPLKIMVSTVRLGSGPGAGAQAFVPTAELSEIYADKVFALGARPYLKPRDVFDLHWLLDRGVAADCSAEDLRIRLATYPNESPAAWLEKAQARRIELAGSVGMVGDDLRRWLPSSWPLDDEMVTGMVRSATGALDRGMAQMNSIEAAAARSPEDDGGPSP